MKKHLLSIITTALVVVNLIMSVVIVFSVLPTTHKINNLVTQICSALALDLEGSGEGVEALKIEDLDEIPIEDEMTIPLKSSGDGEDHYAIVQVAIICNKKNEDYSKYVGSITEKQSLVKDAINSEISSFTIEECQNHTEDVQNAVCERLQELFNSRFIVKVAFKEMVYQ